jgi:hydrogenase expression/formation protein HypE
VGEDACAIEIGGELLVAASDPVTLTAGEAGYLSVLVSANDVAVTGARRRPSRTRLRLRCSDPR